VVEPFNIYRFFKCRGRSSAKHFELFRTDQSCFSVVNFLITEFNRTVLSFNLQLCSNLYHSVATASSVVLE